jgi:hypothetical protein
MPAHRYMTRSHQISLPLNSRKSGKPSRDVKVSVSLVGDELKLSGAPLVTDNRDERVYQRAK